MIFAKLLKYTVVLFFILFETIWASNYYVDAEKGNDRNTGSKQNPWQTFNAVLTHNFNRGDIISFQGGQTFSNARISYITSHTKHLLDGITFTSYGSGKAVIIPDTVNSLNMDWQNDLTFRNLEFTVGNTINAHGFLNFNYCQNLTLDNCIFDGKARVHGWDRTGVLVSSFTFDTMTVKYCVIRNNGVSNGMTGYSHAIYLTGNHLLFENNKISNIPDGQGLKNNGSGTNPTDWTVRYNSFENINQSGIYLQAGYKINIYCNVFVLIPQHSNGIALSHDRLNSNYPNNIHIFNNTIIFSPDSGSNGILLYGYKQIDNVYIKNNIFYSKGYYFGHMFINQQTGGGTNLYINNNLYYTVGKTSDRWKINGTTYSNYTSWKGAGIDKKSKWGNPLFNDLNNGDYTPKKGSPAVNSGVGLGIKKDFKGNPIPPNDPDMGAFQHQYVDVNTKVFLEGPYKNGSMGDNLLLQNLIPKSQPYNTSPWKYSGSESVSAVPANVVDWVLIELRTNINSASTVAKRAGFLLTDGSVVDLDGKSPLRFDFTGSGNYYIVIKHRNHLAVMSSKPVALNGSSALYDFTSSQSKAYGLNPMAALDKNVYGMYGGDGDANGGISSTDRNKIWKHENGSIGYLPGDFDLSSSVDNIDLNSCWRSSNGTLTQVPN